MLRLWDLGDDSIVKVPVDNHFRMRTDLLEEIKTDSREKRYRLFQLLPVPAPQQQVLMIIWKPLPISVKSMDLWMHVDGAHGMGVLFSEKYRNLVKGIERADSVVIDFHKMLLVPALNTLVMFRNGERSFETFAQKASYLFQKSQKNVWYNSAIRTIECTKSATGNNCIYCNEILWQ